MDERKGEVRKEGGMWGDEDGEREGERARGEGKKFSVDVHENGTGANRMSWWNDERVEDCRVHVYKSEKQVNILLCMCLSAYGNC